MKVALLTAENSTCIKKKVGAVLVWNGKILATGYNGAPSKIPHCTRDSCLRILDRDNKNPDLCRGVHAEVNCIVQCAIHGTQIKKGSVIFCTHFPCMSCTKLIINAGIDTIVYLNDYEMDNYEKMDIISQSHLEIYKYIEEDGKCPYLEKFSAKKKLKELMNSILKSK